MIQKLQLPVVFGRPFHIEETVNHADWIFPFDTYFFLNKITREADVWLGSVGVFEDAGRKDFYDRLVLAEKLRLNVKIAVDSEFGKSYDDCTQTETDNKRDLIKRLNRGAIPIERGYKGTKRNFDDPDRVMLVSPVSNDIQAVIFNFLNFFGSLANLSLRGNKPNFELIVPKLLETLEERIQGKVSRRRLPHTIGGYDPNYQPETDSHLLPESSKIAYFISPYILSTLGVKPNFFKYDSKLRRQARRLTAGLADPMERSEIIYKWIRSSIINVGHSIQLQNALDVYSSRRCTVEGLAALQVTMERLAGNRAYLGWLGQDYLVAVHVRDGMKPSILDFNQPGRGGIPDEIYLIKDDLSTPKKRPNLKSREHKGTGQAAQRVIYDEPLATETANRLGINSDYRVLFIGPRTTPLQYYVAQRAGHVDVMELSKESREAIRKKATQMGMLEKMTILEPPESDIVKASFLADRYDLVVCLSVLDLVGESEAVYYKILATTKHKGRIAIGHHENGIGYKEIGKLDRTSQIRGYVLEDLRLVVDEGHTRTSPYYNRESTLFRLHKREIPPSAQGQFVDAKNPAGVLRFLSSLD